MSLSLEPTDWIPHRDPFLFVSRLLEIEPGVRAVGEWQLTGEEWFFPGHFPGRPTTPGVVMLEAMAQVGAVAVLSDERYAQRLPLFGGVENVRFRRQVLPGDLLHLECEMTRLSARGGKGHGRASVNGQTAVEGDLLFIFADAS